jgi:hypothetical protein
MVRYFDSTPVLKRNCRAPLWNNDSFLEVIVMNFSLRWLIAPALALGVALGVPNTSQASLLTFDSNVNEWNSSTPGGIGLHPIGGSGQVNGGFTVATATTGPGAGAQIGLRAELRFFGPVLPQTNDGITADYFAPAGPSTPASLARWNFDIDVDLRTSGKTISDYTATLTFTNIGGLPVTSVPVNLYSGSDPTTTLLQVSDNPGFPHLAGAFPGFNPNANGVYEFDLVLTPSTFTGETLSVSMDVNVGAVPEPGTLMLCGIAITGFAGYTWRRRKLPVA